MFPAIVQSFELQYCMIHAWCKEIGKFVNHAKSQSVSQPNTSHTRMKSNCCIRVSALIMFRRRERRHLPISTMSASKFIKPIKNHIYILLLQGHKLISKFTRQNEKFWTWLYDLDDSRLFSGKVLNLSWLLMEKLY